MEAILTILTSFLMTFGGKQLPTCECGLDVLTNPNHPEILHFSACLDCSGKKISKYTITRQDDKLFVELYARWAIRVPQGDGEFDYMLPDGINEIYLRGENPEDLFLVWKRS